MAKTAAIVIIGNEILSGKIKDENSHFLASELRELGVDVRLIEVLPDDIDVIAPAVFSCSGRFDYVFTSGGVGPTHDDVTMSAIAKAFGLKTVLNETIAESIRARCGELPPGAMKMAEIPEGAEIVELNDKMRFPPVIFRNIYIFPGIPEFLRRKFSLLKERFRSEPYKIMRIYVNEEECFIAPYLDSVVREFQDVEIGSYPKIDSPTYKVVLTLESRDGDSLRRAHERLLGLIPSEVLVRDV